MDQANGNLALIEKFYEKNNHLKSIKLEKGNLKISSDSDIWLLQVPKKLKLNELANKKLKLPGRTNFNTMECVSEEFDATKITALAMPSGKVKVFPVKGRIVAREVLKTMTVAEPSIPRGNKQVPLPICVQRHPLLGVDFQDKLTLRKDVLKRLNSCRKVKNYKTKVKQEVNKEDVDSTCESPNKQIKKEKRKKMNVTNNGDSDLEWIKDLN